jgi:aerobic-type carbon monoxide dehydrogenase small subunit (CoxS/CutS family)
MASNLKITVNGRGWPVESSPDTPLLYVLTNELHLHEPRFGCGLAQCGSCSVLVDDKEIRSCVTPVETVADRVITTLEGLPAWYAQKKGLKDTPSLHPLQQAFIDEQALHCGHCYNGMTVKGAELLVNSPKRSEAEIRQTMNDHLCRCGTYPRIMKSIQAAAEAHRASWSRQLVISH